MLAPVARHLAPASIAMALALVGTACGVSSVDDEDDALGAGRRLLLCQQGLSDRTLDWDKGLFSICEAAEKAGFELVRDGAYPAFGALDENGAYTALFHALDDNHDGYVDGADTPTEVHLVGFSWGGINVTDLADRLRRDGHVATGRRRVAAMVLLDPFQPQVSRATIPSNVVRAWEYRQTQTTAGDCSIYASLGLGFNGHRPKAKSASTHCEVYDLDAFMKDIGHCDVPSAAHKAALVNLVKHEDYVPWDDYGADCPLD
jgi:pimeloyl-ACP methyl ester carboxylesterase